MVSILQTKRPVSPDAPSVPVKVVRRAGGSAGSRAAHSAGAGCRASTPGSLLPFLGLSHLSAGRAWTCPRPVFPVPPLTTQLEEAWGVFLAPDPPECSIFFRWLLGRLAGFSDHVSNFLQAICQISELIAAAFRGEDQLSQPVDLIFMLQETKAKPEFYRVKV